MTIHAVWVINKAGGLVFSRSYSDTLPALPLNTILILAGTLHGVHAITSRLTPGAGSGGMEAFEAEGWGGRVFLTSTGTKFVVLHSIPHTGLEELLKRIYEISADAADAPDADRRPPSPSPLALCDGVADVSKDADAVMKNPFHTAEMPINSSLFESRLQGLIAGVNT